MCSTQREQTTLRRTRILTAVRLRRAMNLLRKHPKTRDNRIGLAHPSTVAVLTTPRDVLAGSAAHPSKRALLVPQQAIGGERCAVNR